MDAELRWEPDGAARGRVALLHGVAARAATWWRIGPELAARGWRVVALDLPGHGAMPKLDRPLDLDLLVSGVVDRLSAPVDLLVGHSLGAITALAVAARQPDAARALVLEDPPGPATADPLLGRRGHRRGQPRRPHRPGGAGPAGARGEPRLAPAGRRALDRRDHRPRCRGGGGGPARAAALGSGGAFVVLDGRHCLHRDLPARWLDAVSAFADRRMRAG